MTIDKTKKAKVIEWMNGCADECIGNNCTDCILERLCIDLDGLAPAMIAQIIIQQQAEIDEAMELLKLAFEDVSDLKDCQHCCYKGLENCKKCGEYEDEINWKLKYLDRYKILKSEVGGKDE
ncbi:MAG: hypothetical protein RR444_05035 [Oscillospiraceae bacterium]